MEPTVAQASISKMVKASSEVHEEKKSRLCAYIGLAVGFAVEDCTVAKLRKGTDDRLTNFMILLACRISEYKQKMVQQFEW